VSGRVVLLEIVGFAEPVLVIIPLDDVLSGAAVGKLPVRIIEPGSPFQNISLHNGGRQTDITWQSVVCTYSNDLNPAITTITRIPSADYDAGSAGKPVLSQNWSKYDIAPAGQWEYYITDEFGFTRQNTNLSIYEAEYRSLLSDYPDVTGADQRINDTCGFLAGKYIYSNFYIGGFLRLGGTRTNLPSVSYSTGSFAAKREFTQLACVLSDDELTRKRLESMVPAPPDFNTKDLTSETDDSIIKNALENFNISVPSPLPFTFEINRNKDEFATDYEKLMELDEREQEVHDSLNKLYREWETLAEG
jgi:hypothetical protein